jgi:dipeptidyl aminopeptidase/acylaminoacyl peptidase
LDCSIATADVQANWKFVFASQEKLRIKAGDAEPRVLTDMGNITAAKISPDGNLVVFTRENSPSDTELWSVNADGSEIHRLIGENALEGRVNIFRGEFFSPDGKIYVFGLEPKTESVKNELWAANLDGSGAKKLVGIEDLRSDFDFSEESSVYILFMTWIPGTSRLLFVPYEDELVFNPLMWVDAETGEFGEFLPKGRGGDVTFSPDGSKYVVATNSIVSLGTMENQEILAEITYPDIEYRGEWLPRPGWAPDSSKFLVALPPDDIGLYQDYTVPAPVTIWSVSMDGTDPVELINITADIREIEYSPDFENIAFSAWDSIEILDQSGSVLNTLTLPNDGFGMTQMVINQWSPDSIHFSYLTGSNDCACGIDVIADVCGNEPLNIQDEAYFSGYVPGFITWLDPKHYIRFDYSSQDFTANLVLSELGGVEVSWTMDNSDHDPVVDFWTP